METTAHENWQLMMAKLAQPPDEIVRLRCLGALFGVFGDNEHLIEYIEEAERQDGYRYWTEQFLVDGEIDFKALIKDMHTYLEALDVNTG